MKDERMTSLRKSLEDVIDSLESMLRLARWSEADAAPESLEQSASRLLSRLGTAERMASGRFTGASIDGERAEAMAKAMRRLDAAYVAYRRALAEAPARGEAIASTLDAEIENVKADVRRLG